MRRTQTTTRNLATADPNQVVRYIDAGWTPEQWQVITEAMRRYMPQPSDPNVVPKVGNGLEPRPKPSLAAMLGSRQVQDQIRARTV